MRISNLRKMLTQAAAPVISYAPPWWQWRLYSRLVGNPYTSDGFTGLAERRRLHPHGYEVELSLDNWMERYAYLVGAYYDPVTIQTIQRCLRDGDWFIDIGANVGLVTLTGASQVGPKGRVLAFEPNPRAAQRLEANIQLNNLTNIDVLKVALGAEDNVAMLDASLQHGTGSLRTDRGVPVPLRRGDAFVSGIPDDAWVFVKVDVEGYEQRVLSGLSRFLTRNRVAFLIEITDAWLREMGGSAETLFRDLRAAGFDALVPTLSIWSNLKFRRIEGPLDSHQYDIFFTRLNEEWLDR